MPPMQCLGLAASFFQPDQATRRDGTPHPAHAGPSRDRLPEVPGLAPRDRRERVVVVSNRQADPDQPAAGGLAVALGDSMKATPGLWFGWSGRINDGNDAAQVRRQPFGRTTLARVDLSQRDYDRYYAGFANSVLWPVFHEQLGQARLDDAFFGGYERVNRMFAAGLAPLLEEDDLVWVHDYHLIPLAAELRRLGCRQRIGFFNHIPFPAPGTLARIPQHEQLVRWLFSYDLVGMQTRADVENFHAYVQSRADGHRLDAAHAQAFGRTVRTQHFPIGIDAAGFAASALTPVADAGPMMARMRRERGHRMLMVCAARLDYTKGLAEGLEAFRLLLEQHPGWRGRVTWAQIASPSREGIEAYEAMRDELEALVSDINGQYGCSGWTPVLYLNEAVDHRVMPEFFRLGRLGVVMSRADGMNLAAKEYVAAQRRKNPGVLVLSSAAGAAEQLKQALIVDPRDPAAIARAYHRGLRMSLCQRRGRHAALLANVRRENLQWWRAGYLQALGQGAGEAPDRQRATRSSKAISWDRSAADNPDARRAS
jgi:trehalose 6-phosphate synthase